MNITFASLKTTGKVETVWCVLDLGMSNYYSDLGYRDHIRDYLIVWGRRGGKLQTIVKRGHTKISINKDIYDQEFRENMWGFYQITYGQGMAIAKRIYKILKKDYIPFKADSLEEIDPNLPEQLNKLVFWETMKL